MIQRLLNRAVVNEHMTDIFELTHPKMQMKVINIKMFINAVFMMRVKAPVKSRKPKNGEAKHSLILKGKILILNPLPDDKF